MSYSIGMSEVHNKKVSRAIKRKVTKVVAKPIVKHTELSTVVKRPVGRPKKLNDEQVVEVCIAFSDYIDSNDDPTIPGFTSGNPVAIKYGLFKQDMVDYDVTPQFRVLAKRAIEKQESYLLKQSKTPILSIFRLKQPQHGYKDRVDIEVEGNTTVTHTVDPSLALDFKEYLKSKTIE